MKDPSLPAAMIVDSDSDDVALANSAVLTREEVLKRRSRRLRRLAKCYRDYYWSLMDDVRRKHREYYWKYGKSPFKEDDELTEERENAVLLENVNVENNNDGLSNGDHQNLNGNGDVENGGGGRKLGLGFGPSFNQCDIDRCTNKAMPLTNFCHSHILYDSRQTLYVCCSYRLSAWRDRLNYQRPPIQPCKTSSTDTGTIQCRKPILRGTIPSLCPAHVLKVEKAIRMALRKGGVSASSSAKLASKLHWVISEYVHLIQSRRRAAATKATGDLTMMDSST